MSMDQVVLDFDASAMTTLLKDPDEFAQEIKTAAVVQWHAEGRISQGKGAELLGTSRARFLDELYRRRAHAAQVDASELREELACLTD
jgi:predicted HTH domain antitoxin